MTQEKEIWYLCLYCFTEHSEEECDEAAYHRQENGLICPDCCLNNLRKL